MLWVSSCFPQRCVLCCRVVLAQQESWTREQILRKFSLDERQLRQWEKHGFIPVRERYAFRELAALRTLAALKQKSVPLSRIKQAFEALRAKGDGVENPFADLKILNEGGHIRVRMSGRAMEAVSGQFVLDFDGVAEQSVVRAMPVVTKPKPVNPVEQNRKLREAEEWFQRGLELEQSEATKDAINAYLRVVQLNPQAAGAWVNLGTIHFHLADWNMSRFYYEKALEVDPNYPLANFNMGNLLEELAYYDKALQFYEKAVRLNPQYADAYYNLALLYQQKGQVLKAMRYWTVYLKLDGDSKWAKIARRELDRLKRERIVTPRQNTEPAGKGRKTVSRKRGA